MPDDLDLVPTDALIDALLARFESCIIAGERPAEKPVEGVEVHWCGSLASALGWASFAGAIIADHLRLELPEALDEEAD